MKCVHCGNDVPEGSKFCPACGKDPQSYQSPPQQGYQQPGGHYGQGMYGHDVHPVGVGIRIAAGIIDLIALIVVSWVIAFFTGGTTSSGFELKGVSAFVSFIINMGYFIGFEGVMGATPGKMAVGLKVIKTDGSSYDITAAAIRNIMRIVDGFPYLIPYLLGMILIATSERKQRLGDRVAHTMVVKR
jgi:uncharacterized RDD family membrane protein YckC